MVIGFIPLPDGRTRTDRTHCATSYGPGPGMMGGLGKLMTGTAPGGGLPGLTTMKCHRPGRTGSVSEKALLSRGHWSEEPLVPPSQSQLCSFSSLPVRFWVKTVTWRRRSGGARAGRKGKRIAAEGHLPDIAATHPPPPARASRTSCQPELNGLDAHESTCSVAPTSSGGACHLR